MPFSSSSWRKLPKSIPARVNNALCPLAMPTTFKFNPRSCFSFSCCPCICSKRLPPTVPTPQTNRFKTWYSDRKKESWITFSDLRREPPSTTNDMFVSEAPCAHAITFIPLRPNVPNNFPAIPGVCFMFSPTIATVASPLSAFIGEISPISISFANSSFKTSHAKDASSFRTPIEVEFSEDAWDTRNTLIPFSARALNIR